MKKMGLFGKSKPADPKAQVDEWCKKLRKEGYSLDRQVRQIQRSVDILTIKEPANTTNCGASISARRLDFALLNSFLFFF